ncbi:hypothetical protein BOTBODRAFT_111119, partial [Botryobasidium botryosum FD-172 SS1]
RFRLIDPFGRDTIRRFSHNVSEMKKFAARDFEDVLQASSLRCMIPALEGLLPQPHDINIRNLLIAATEVHSLAKLRLHTEVTLHDLEAALLKYGHLIRDFATETCPCFKTTKTPKEREAAARRKAKQAARAATNALATSSMPPQQPQSKEDNIEVYYSLTRPKFHALFYWLKDIRLFGTLEGFSALRVRRQSALS